MMTLIFLLTCSVNVRDHGAIPNDTIDDRPGIQAAILAANSAGGGRVCLEAGVYVLRSKTAASGAILSLTLTDVEVVGAGAGVTELKVPNGTNYQALGIGDPHLIELTGSTNVRFADLTLNGNLTNTTNTNEQSHGLRIRNSSNVRVERVTFTDMKGDGVQILGSATPTAQVIIADSRFIGNRRSGIAIQSATRDVVIQRNYFEGQSDQDIDFEPTGCNTTFCPQDYDISHNTFRGNGRLLVTLVGQDLYVARRIAFRFNQVWAGNVWVMNCEDCAVVGNQIINDSTLTGGVTYNSEAALYLRERTPGLVIRDNLIRQRNVGAARHAVQTVSTSNQDPSFVFEGNDVFQGKAANALMIDQPGNHTRIVNNRIVGGTVGIMVRRSSARKVRNYAVAGNEVRNAGAAIFLKSDNGMIPGAEWEDLEVSHNFVWNDGGTTTYGIRFGESGASANYFARWLCKDNRVGPGVTTGYLIAPGQSVVCN